MTDRSGGDKPVRRTRGAHARACFRNIASTRRRTARRSRGREVIGGTRAVHAVAHFGGVARACGCATNRRRGDQNARSHRTRRIAHLTIIGISTSGIATNAVGAKPALTIRRRRAGITQIVARVNLSRVRRDVCRGIPSHDHHSAIDEFRSAGISVVAVHRGRETPGVRGWIE